jgi:Holliday junction DNA helicase RuvA
MTISQNTYESLPRATSDTLPQVKLYTYMSVREDGIEMFGFASEAELSSFKMLLGVSGVGPKAAISILSLLTPEKFALAVCTDDKKTIAKANGIGPKTAARIILELQDKLLKQTPPEETKAAISTAMTSSGTSKGKLSEAQDALGVLGYSRSEALNALQGIDVSAMEIEDIIRAALKKLMK